MCISVLQKSFYYSTQPYIIIYTKALNLFISTQFIYFIVVDNQDGGYIGKNDNDFFVGCFCCIK